MTIERITTVKREIIQMTGEYVKIISEFNKKCESLEGQEVDGETAIEMYDKYQKIERLLNKIKMNEIEMAHLRQERIMNSVKYPLNISDKLIEINLL